MSEKKDESIKLISFIRSPAKHGPYYIFTIPNSFIKHGLIDPGKTYRIYLEEIEDKDGEKK